MAKSILVVAAHPDDEVLGCGGTVARLIKEGCKAYTLILGEGVTSRSKGVGDKRLKLKIATLKKQMQKANKILGINQVFSYSFADNKFDSVPFLEIVKVIEEIKNKIKPEIIFTHWSDDLNIDHRIIYQAVLTATRPLPGESVKQLFSFEVLSSSEWRYDKQFLADTLFDITRTLKQKLCAMKAYKLELKNSRHPRSLKGILLNAEYRGIGNGLKYAEAFKSVRVIR